MGDRIQQIVLAKGFLAIDDLTARISCVVNEKERKQSNGDDCWDILLTLSSARSGSEIVLKTAASGYTFNKLREVKPFQSTAISINRQANSIAEWIAGLASHVSIGKSRSRSISSSLLSLEPHDGMICCVHFAKSTELMSFGTSLSEIASLVMREENHRHFVSMHESIEVNASAA